MTETDTKHLILQALRELEIEDVEVKASTSKPGTYDITRTETIASIPMDCSYKSIVSVLKHVKGQTPELPTTNE